MIIIIDKLKVFESYIISSTKEKEKCKQRYIDACRERGIEEKEIKRRINYIEKVAEKCAKIAANELMRELEDRRKKK